MRATCGDVTRRSHGRPGCTNPVENRYGTCNECQDSAYDGDANGEW
jgi:hypothetical protein